MRKKLALAAPLALLTLAATACGGDDTKAYDAWAKKVCGPAKPQLVASETARLDLGRVHRGETPEALQKRLSGDLGKLSEANNGLARAIDKAGTPQVDDKDEVDKTRTDAVSELRSTASGYGKVQTKVDALKTGDQHKFASGLESLSGQTTALAKSSDKAMKSLKKGKLGEAMTRQPGCKKIDADAVPQPSEPAVSPTPSGSSSAQDGKEAQDGKGGDAKGKDSKDGKDSKGKDDGGKKSGKDASSPSDSSSSSTHS